MELYAGIDLHSNVNDGQEPFFSDGEQRFLAT